ncbi:hypothetical protein CLORY_07040 [Clostridium oryzae]|uniref:Lipoprotein n=1 Tax=Clostridium oryzae TaxID=1450648 RepID=A0A1V4IW25_9CLOT|nr:hypothetical protein CLORY_07040 [Clostridium oryzae]
MKKFITCFVIILSILNLYSVSCNAEEKDPFMVNGIHIYK